MKIISFEGIEGVGKSTQIDLLHDYLLNAGKSVKKFREPGSTIPSEKIRNILLDANLTLTSQTELLLMYASRSELVTNEILSNQHDFILLDRYFDLLKKEEETKLREQRIERQKLFWQHDVINMSKFRNYLS